MLKFKETIIVSVGGSLISKDELDIDFLLSLKEVILKLVNQGYRFVLITGGGKICRKYNEAAKKLNKKVTDRELDWMGIKATKVNAELVRIIFNHYAYYKVLDRPDERLIKAKNIPVIVAGGWKPGASSDNMAVNLAKKFKAKKVINLSNIDYVYDKDPNKFKDAKRIEKINWLEFINIVGNKWDPGANLPFDPIASQLAAKLKLEVFIANGNNIWNLISYIKGGSFIGTVIK